MNLKIGDIVGRKSYGCDIIFKVYNISKDGEGENIVLLRGINVRLMADSPESDLVLLSQEDVDKDAEVFAARMRSETKSKSKGKRDKKGIRALKKETSVFKRPGKVLHLDGDGEYLKLCIKEYEKMGIEAYGYEIVESEQPKIIKKLLNEIYPDILVITGHDGILKGGNKDYSDIKNYRNSKHFIESVKEARRFEPSLDDLIIIAGACQSHYEAILFAGANFASSPDRILIHALDPVKVCGKIALTPIDQVITAEDISINTLSGIDGIGGISTKGKYRDGAPKPRYIYKQGGDVNVI